MDITNEARAWRTAMSAFAQRAGSYADVKQADAEMRAAGYDPATGLTTIDAKAAGFTDRIDGHLVKGANASIMDDRPAWFSLSDGTSREYPDGTFIEVRDGARR